MKLFYTDHFVLPLPEGHRFPMEKYALLRQRLKSCGHFAPNDFIEAPAATDEDLHRAHCPGYIQRVISGTLTPAEIRRIGFPWSEGMVERSRRSAGATLAASIGSLKEGVCANLAGGTHHAGYDFGAGFCVFNDAAIAIRALQAEGKIQRAMVIDCDVHQGDGTAAIFARDESVWTLSLHGEKNFPFQKQASRLDVNLPDGTRDEPYLDALKAALQTSFAAFQPDCVIYLAGADPFEGDRLGRLKLTQEGLAERDRIVFEAVTTRGLPLTIAMAGGYADPIENTVAIQAHTLIQAKITWQPAKNR